MSKGSFIVVCKYARRLLKIVREYEETAAYLNLTLFLKLQATSRVGVAERDGFITHVVLTSRKGFASNHL